MKHTKNEILKALTIIKEVCEEIGDCTICPCGDCMGVCLVSDDVPTSWEIKEVEEVWRAFK